MDGIIDLEKLMEVLISFLDTMKGFGIDGIIVLGIMFFGQAIKNFFKPKRKTVFVIIVGLGLAVSLFKIIIENEPVENWLLALFGYPGMSIGLYMFLKMFVEAFKKKFLKSTKDCKNCADTD